jgi:multidrug efflux pump subunit AcrB
VTFLQTAQSLFLFRPLQKGAGSLRPGNRFRLHGIYVIEPRAKPAAAKVRAHLMSRSRRHVLVLCLVIASVTAGVAYRIFSFTSERAQVGQNSGQSSGLNMGRMFVELKPRGERPDLQRVLSDLRRETGRVPGINTYATAVQNLRIGGRSSRAEFQFVMQSLDRNQLYEWSQKMADAMTGDSHFADVNSDLQVNATEATLVIDKDKANSLGISAEKLRSTLYSGFGSRQVSTIYKTGDTFSVILEFTDKANWTPAILPDVRIRNAAGKLVPIGSFARVQRTAGSYGSC